MNILFSEIVAHRNPLLAQHLCRFFKTGKGEYGEGDVFLGVKVPITRTIVKAHWNEVTFEDLKECITSDFHEVRLVALLTLVQFFKHAKKNAVMRKRCVDFYLKHLRYVNNWDLVDLSCYEILGPWLLDKDRSLLYDFAANGKTLWERRIGMVTTMTFIRNNELDDTYAIAEVFLKDGKGLHDLLQKAVGWLLREAGERDMERLRAWLMVHVKEMPRTMLRYSIEKFPEEERKGFLRM